MFFSRFLLITLSKIEQFEFSFYQNIPLWTHFQIKIDYKILGLYFYQIFKFLTKKKLKISTKHENYQKNHEKIMKTFHYHYYKIKNYNFWPKYCMRDIIFIF